MRQNTPLNSDPAVLSARRPSVPTLLRHLQGQRLATRWATPRTCSSRAFTCCSPRALWQRRRGLVRRDGLQPAPEGQASDIFAGRQRAATRASAAWTKDTTKDAWALRVIFEPSYFQVDAGRRPVRAGRAWATTLAGKLIGRWATSPAVCRDGGDYSIGIKRLKWARTAGPSRPGLQRLTSARPSHLHRDRWWRVRPPARASLTYGQTLKRPHQRHLQRFRNTF